MQVGQYTVSPILLADTGKFSNMAQQIPEICQICSLFSEPENFCAQLSNGELCKLNRKSQTESVKRGASIGNGVLQQWPIIAINSGVLSFKHQLENGRSAIAAIFMRGDILDMRDLSNRNQGRFVALSKVEICKLSPTVFERIVKVNEDARNVAWSNLREQAFRATDHAIDLTKKQALEKLASFIFECDRRQETGVVKNTVHIPIRRRELGEYLGLQSETVSRCFRQLEDQGIIKVLNLSTVMMTNVAALEHMARGGQEYLK